jgi:ribonuclease P protein component
VLPAPHRLRDGAAFGHAVRRGRRVGGPVVVLHLLTPDPSGPGSPARIGLVVSRAVGNAVHRNRVKRRLRNLMRDRLARLPEGATLVVRALPPAAGATSAELAGELDRGLSRLLDGPS